VVGTHSRGHLDRFPTDFLIACPARISARAAARRRPPVEFGRRSIGCDEAEQGTACRLATFGMGGGIGDMELGIAGLEGRSIFRSLADRRATHSGTRAPTPSDIEGSTDRYRVGLGFETEISRRALDFHMAQERSNRLQIASAFQNVESLRSP